ncbi:MAG: hypothetical protein P1V51_00535 [Deltaproteobacteria bacterium]|nr:hypothetical protein [Deltaproteobacteria bacterium]
MALLLPGLASADVARIGLRPVAGADEEAGLRATLTDGLVEALRGRAAGRLEVLAPSELTALAERAALDQLLGCDTGECAGQLLTALEIDGLIHGRLGRLDGRPSLTLSLLDRESHEAIARAQRFLPEDAGERAALLGEMAEVLLRPLLAAPAEAVALTPAKGAMRIALSGLAAKGVEPELARVLTDVLMIELEKLPEITVVSPDDLAAMMDRAALEQLLGCGEDCDLDLLGAAEADHLLVGSVGRVGSQHLLSLSLLDRASGRARARDRQQLSGDHARLVAAVESAVFNLLAEARGEGLGKPLAVGSLEALRAAQRRKPGRVALSLGPGLYVPLGVEPMIQAPSFAARLSYEHALAEVVLVGVALELDSLTSTSSKLSFLGDLDSGQAAYNRLESELALNSYRGILLVAWRRAYGLVLPHVGLGLGLGYFDLLLGDEHFVPVEPRDTLPIAGLMNVREDDSALAPILEVGGGVELLFTRHLGVLIDLRLFRVFHDLEVRSQISGMNEERPLVAPFQALQGVALRLGLIWEV